MTSGKIGRWETRIDDYVTLLEDDRVTGTSERCVLVLREEAEHVDGQRFVGLYFSAVSTSVFTCTCAYCRFLLGVG